MSRFYTEDNYKSGSLLRTIQKYHECLRPIKDDYEVDDIMSSEYELNGLHDACCPSDYDEAFDWEQ